MGCYLKLPLLALGLTLGMAASGTGAPDAQKGSGKKERSDKKTREKSEESRKPKMDSEGRPKMSLPIPQGHDSKGLKIPYFDGNGKLQMSFMIGVADRLDEDHIQMKMLRVETFNEKGESEMVIDLPSSVLDLNTRIISTSERATVKRADFEITGKTMEFNTETKQGKMGGNVRMLIYNLTNEAPESEEKTGE